MVQIQFSLQLQALVVVEDLTIQDQMQTQEDQVVVQEILIQRVVVTHLL